jgi:hypothetical protein
MHPQFKITWENLFWILPKKENSFQRLASSRVTGTDTDAFAYSNGGVGFDFTSFALHAYDCRNGTDDVECHQINIWNHIEIREQRNVFLF